MPTTERFQFFVVTRTPSMDMDLQRVVVTSDLQVSLSEQFLEQGEEFTATDVQKRSFHGTYKPNKDEVVAIRPFPIPALLGRAAKNPQEFSEIQMPFTEHGPLVRAILGVDDGKTSGVMRFFFQHFDKTHILKPKRTFLFQSGMFNELTHPGVTISDHLTAVIVGTELLFRSFQRTNQFLDLTPHFKEATDGEIKALLSHATFFKNDSDAIIAICKPAMRKRFSAILNAKVLDHPLATPDRIRNRAKRFGIDLQTKVVSGSKKLVFPEDRGEAMKLLQYLAEELYFSDLTEQACETNSHRPLELPTDTPT
jgi:hypothetical protein